VIKKVKKNYINNAEFFEAVKAYKKQCVEAESAGESIPRIPNYIGECVFKIATRLASRPNFSGYSYKEDMISDGLENAIQALGNFDPDKSSNPFAYFTQIIWYAFLRRIDKEKKQMYIKHKVVENSVIHGTAIEKNQGDSGEAAFIDLNNDYMSNFVQNFEDAMERKKVAKKEKEDAKGVELFYDIPDDPVETED
jgi:DNA-directed RNA polymerase specialized sigma subunit|tara:strand:- start:1454 stop:2038 length:585 start_codon:yes stop_codon:yes gene_type:complete